MEKYFLMFRLEQRHLRLKGCSTLSIAVPRKRNQCLHFSVDSVNIWIWKQLSGQLSSTGSAMTYTTDYTRVFLFSPLGKFFIPAFKKTYLSLSVQLGQRCISHLYRVTLATIAVFLPGYFLGSYYTQRKNILLVILF